MDLLTLEVFHQICKDVPEKVVKASQAVREIFKDYHKKVKKKGDGSLDFQLIEELACKLHPYMTLLTDYFRPDPERACPIPLLKGRNGNPSSYQFVTAYPRQQMLIRDQILAWMMRVSNRHYHRGFPLRREAVYFLMGQISIL